jgi:alpha-amylase/alpha-mannosidase (GH57 family)
MMDTYLCIHGHFYQPPRENPWLRAIEYQASAYPYHDWNERVTRECYGPNTRARLADAKGHILKLINNYEFMSFDFGPTLLSWLETAHPWIYEQILAADRAGRARFHGHGNAMAQVYNHIIMPLASTRDKLTQIRWGVADFEHRFGRRPEGMWLAETAVDLETLALMAGEGIRFTVLAPTQATAVRSLGPGQEEWTDVLPGKMETTCPYRVFPDPHSSLHMDVFFYDGELSKAVAYEKILSSGDSFLSRIENGVCYEREGACLVNVATDGESYGHHFKFGDMALGWLFDELERGEGLHLCNYGWFLEEFPPRMEVRIKENTSWSCAHGVERWRSDCGCSVGQREGWTQAWRAPLREAMDWLSRELSAVFEKRGRAFFNDPWEARDDYVAVLLDPSPEGRKIFLDRHAGKKALGPEDMVRAFELLESQRMGLYMFTSCGWFFDDISGLEVRQVLMYADRAMALVRRWAGSDLEPGFLSHLSRAGSNDPAYGDGKSVFEKHVLPGRKGAGKIAAGYGTMRLFCEGLAEPGGYFSRVQSLREEEAAVPRGRGRNGEVRIVDPMTGGTQDLAFSAEWKGDVDFRCRVRHEEGDETIYTLEDLGPDIEQAILNCLSHSVMRCIQSKLIEEEEMFAALVELRRRGEEGAKERNGLNDLLQLFLRANLATMPGEGCEEMGMRTAKMNRLVSPGEDGGPSFNLDDLEDRKLSKSLIDALMARIARMPDPECMAALKGFLNLIDALSLRPDLWDCQNRYWDLTQDRHFTASLSGKNVAAFRTLGERLGFILSEV